MSNFGKENVRVTCWRLSAPVAKLLKLTVIGPTVSAEAGSKLAVITRVGSNMPGVPDSSFMVFLSIPLHRALRP